MNTLKTIFGIVEKFYLLTWLIVWCVLCILKQYDIAEKVRKMLVDYCKKTM